MKKTVLILLLTALSTFKIAAQDYRDAKAYLLGVGEIQELVSKHTWEFNQNIAHATNLKRVEAERASFVGELKKILIRMSNIEAFNDDLTFKREIISYLRNMITYYGEECKRLLDYQVKSLESIENMEKYYIMHEQLKLKVLNEIALLNANQKKFGEKYNVLITKNNSEVGLLLNKSTELSRYVSEIYLIFFRANITEVHQTQSIDNNNAAAFFKNNQLLNQYSVEGLQKLAKIKNYENDKSLNTTVRLILEAYIIEANKILPVMKSYFTLDEQFKLAAEKIKDPAKTATDVRNYNELAKNLNAISVVYNNMNAKLNQQSKLIEKNWTEAQSRFLMDYMPTERALTSN